MAAVLKAVSTGPWGAEPIPECTAEVASMADAVFRAVMTGEVASSSSLEVLVLLDRECPDADPAVKAEAIQTAGEMLAARARRLVVDPVDPSCDGSGSPSCGICGSLTARQSDCAGRLYGGALTGRLDLGNTEDCWLLLAKGPDSVSGLTWDDFQPARTAAIRMVQARARLPSARAIASAEAALIVAEELTEPGSEIESATPPGVFYRVEQIRSLLRTALQPERAAERATAAAA